MEGSLFSGQLSGVGRQGESDQNAEDRMNRAGPSYQRDCRQRTCRMTG